MSDSIQAPQIHPIHPFPARMAPSIAWESLPGRGRSLRVLDPMAGSGTTLVVAKAKGHKAIGYDTDPLATLIARAWCSEVDAERLTVKAYEVLDKARDIARTIPFEKAYPYSADEETKRFIDFWFDTSNRLQLTALSQAISLVSDPNTKNLLWVAFSRLIITKKVGVSLAMDVSHSRPHRKYQYAPVRAFDVFLRSVDHVIKKAPFRSRNEGHPSAIIARGDARRMPLPSNSIDMVITSPPYLNAIDYLRGHKLSLIWMGYSINALRRLRSSNIGVERPLRLDKESPAVTSIFERMGRTYDLDKRSQGMIKRFLYDMKSLITEVARVLKLGGRAVFVVGDSTMRGVFIKNSLALIELAAAENLELASRATRPIPESRRYLPPPNLEKSGKKMQKRMREEVVLEFVLRPSGY